MEGAEPEKRLTASRALRDGQPHGGQRTKVAKEEEDIHRGHRFSGWGMRKAGKREQMQRTRSTKTLPQKNSKSTKDFNPAFFRG
jgi:hypothetical protein